MDKPMSEKNPCWEPYDILMDRMETQERNECPCGEPLESWSGLEYIPAFLYCPKCMNRAYNEDGEVLFELE